ncbi:Ulp1 protease [Histoplasma capsulatum var. duboisii H88]|uniref:Ulp1 protease n=1 Tax=Ajellomyces capsulatus (strain H88) TaxID=544711 RepID=A0A8A1L993_AJEC8|nr:Ulp1 protease [Histoplasma capsulatum var. duboisii H88]
MGEGGFNRFKDKMRGRFNNSSSPDDAYLSYHDVRLTNEDVHTLKTDWLTDNVIAFWEEYLEREFLVNYQSANIVLLRPSMSFMLLQTPDPRTLREALPDFTKTSHVFLPINDCRNVNEAEGGTHWSLLLVSVVDGVAFHYDSLPPGNCEEALQATLKLSHLLNRQLCYINLDDSPVQENSSDCGVFVCLHMRQLLLKRLLMANSSEKISMSLGGTRVNASNGRKEIVRIIERLRKKGERRRSLSVNANINSDGTPDNHREKRSRSPPRIE